MNHRVTGTVKWFNAVRGYGFITQDNGKDVFVHWTAIYGNKHRSRAPGQRATLLPGQRVTFLVKDTPKGPCAIDVRLWVERAHKPK